VCMCASVMCRCVFETYTNICIKIQFEVDFGPFIYDDEILYIMYVKTKKYVLASALGIIEYII